MIAADTVIFDVFLVELDDACGLCGLCGLLFFISVAVGCRHLDTVEVDSGARERAGRTEHGFPIFGISGLAGEVEVG